MRRLSVFHNRCVRFICRVSLWHTRRFKISQKSLEERIELNPLEFYLNGRRLAWAGRVARMNPDTQFPRKFLSCWVYHRRPRGRPQQTWAHGFKSDLAMIGFDASSSLWMEFAQDEMGWNDHWETVLKNYNRFAFNPLARVFEPSAPSSEYPTSYADAVRLGTPLSYADVVSMPAPTQVNAQTPEPTPEEIAPVEPLNTESVPPPQEVAAPRRGARKRTGLAYQDSWYINPSRMSTSNSPPTRRNNRRD